MQSTMHSYTPSKNCMAIARFYILLGPCPSRGALVSGVGPLSQGILGLQTPEIGLCPRHTLEDMYIN